MIRTILLKPKGPDPRNYRGQNSKLVKGPDPVLCRGSDLTNLLNTKSLAIGPDKANCKGSFKNSILKQEEDSEFDLIKSLFININLNI